MKLKRENLKMEEMLILVDDKDEEIGIAGKKEVHIKGLLHRAISVFIFNENGELLLQRRALNKYHSAGLWTNTCCSHPAPGETTLDASIRRLKEEMKLETKLDFLCSFQYNSNLENGLIENELDHVFYGVTNQIPDPDPLEASEWKYINTDVLIGEVNNNPQLYTSWLKICIDRNIFSNLLKAK